ncbi:MAG TPA: histone deacetylase [Tepidisphaeraceae bacterium]|nr:histone deacetylase [Tepidisphaeraceae bacterium]
MPDLIAYHHADFAAPIGERHVMPMRKFALVADAVRAMPHVRVEAPQPLAEADLYRVHAPAYVEAVKTGIPRELAESQKFPWSPQLYPSVLLTGGGVYAAAKRALSDGVAAAVASGFHHSHAERGEGFCTFNGLVVAIDRLRAEGVIGSAAVLDCDLHYGNGTALLARTRPHLLALSVYGNDYWDNVAYRDVSVGRHEDGDNHRSFALPAKCDGPTLLATLAGVLPLILERRPDVLLYQAGADPYFEDPYSPLALTHDDLKARDRLVFDFARRHRIPIAWVLAGGYTPDTAKVVRVHTNTFEAAGEVFGGR